MNYDNNNKHNTGGPVTRYLEFSLGAESCAIPLLSVKEVIAPPDITPIPHSPSHFLGIMNLRGQVISVVDLRLKFGVKVVPSPETVVIICDLGQVSLGVMVNAANSVLQLTPDDIQPRPEITHSKAGDYITGVTRKDKKLILLLDIARALDVTDHQAIKKIQPEKITA